MDILQHTCPLMDLSVCPDKIDINCQLKELKPKQLEWSHSEDFSTYTATPNKYMIFMFKQYVSGSSYVYINDKHVEKYDGLKNSELMEICQELYNKLFYEMIGE